MSLTKEQLEEGWDTLDLAQSSVNPFSQEREDFWRWISAHGEDLFQMAKASLLVNLDPTKNAPDRVEENPQPTMKEAIEALRGFAPDFPQEPQPANCCGNCRHFATQAFQTIGFCHEFLITMKPIEGNLCIKHQRKPDATNT